MHSTDLDRRRLCTALASTAACGLGMHSSLALTERTGLCIDVHQHYLPEFYRQAAAAAGLSQPDGIPGLPKWDVQSALDIMDRRNIGTGVLSISSPGVHFGDVVAAQSLARAVNEAGAKAVSMHPKRFGLFASLPLPDMDVSLRELEYALDTLHADGIALETNHRGIYLGDARFEPLFNELNRRGALVFIHPTSPYCPTCQGTDKPGLRYPAPMLEFMFDTTRAITHLILSGTLQRNPKVRIIVPHAGAALPTLSDRIVGIIPALGIKNTPSGAQVLEQLRGLYYDLAGLPVPKMLDALLMTTTTDHLLYGSDWPFTVEPVVTHLRELFDATPRFDAATRQMIVRDNALKLLPRLRVT